MAILEHIKSPADLKDLSLEELQRLSAEIRERIISVTSENGGHVGPNLGVVELTVAMHQVFDCPKDKVVFDVSHQAYVHKLLTGRNTEAFDRIRLTDGLSGFCSREESEADAFGSGHAGTALSAALGMAAARDLRGSDEHIIAFVGDASFTCGVTMEALNNLVEHSKRLIVILNDNEWSIARNVGAISRYFNELITNPIYNRIDRDVSGFLKKIPGGDSLVDLTKRWKKETKDFILPSSLFETYGMRYVGPIDGHNLEQLKRYLEFAKNSDWPILLHVMTTKGLGYEPALNAPEKFHGTSPYDIETGETRSTSAKKPLTYQAAFGQSLLKYAKHDKRIVGITAAMPPGTGLVYMRENLPEQFFDVGIAEEHGVLFAAGMAVQGQKPVVAIYSTFLQRAYDMIIHDVCLQRLPVVFCMDRAGLSPNDGPTHHGLFDIAYLRCVPNTVILQPKDEDELADMLWTALGLDEPVFIRYPRGYGLGKEIKKTPLTLDFAKAEVIQEGCDIVFWALGPWVATAKTLALNLEEQGYKVGIVNPRFIKPFDRDLLRAQAEQCRLLVTMEDHVRTGGFGSAILEFIADEGLTLPVERISWPDQFIEHGSSVDDLKKANALDHESLLKRVLKRLKT